MYNTSSKNVGYSVSTKTESETTKSEKIHLVVSGITVNSSNTNLTRKNPTVVSTKSR